MALILQAAPIKHYGVVVNQVSEQEYENLQNQTTLQLLKMYILAGSSPVSSFIYFQPRIEEFRGAKDKYVKMPGELRKFIRTVPTTVIPARNVSGLEVPASVGSVADLLRDRLNILHLKVLGSVGSVADLLRQLRDRLNILHLKVLASVG